MNVVRDNNQTYSIIHIEDKENIACKVKMNAAFKDELICQFEKATLSAHEPLENRFFTIKFYESALRITPKYNFEFYPFKKSFIKDETIGTDKHFSYSHWTVVGFKKESKLYTKENQEGLSFPIIFNDNKLTAIGELNFDLIPIEKNINASAIVKIKEAYENKKYDKALKEADYLLEEPNSIFSNEAKLYKIRALDKIINDAGTKNEEDGLDPLDIIEGAEEWIGENPSNENLPEMYMYMAKTYIKMGRSSKADKYLTILDNEYKDNKYNYIAKLHNADRIYKVKDKDEAIKKYKEVLYNTKEFDTASMAALKLSSAYMDKENIIKSKLFFDKVITANRDFIKSHPEESYKLAKRFADNNESNISLKIGGLIKDDIEGTLISRDELKKNIAYWHEQSKDNDKAIELYQNYLYEEEYGKYRDFISERLDKVMLNSNEKNETKKLAYLDTIMIKYKDDAIYAKALLAKANIYLKNKAYVKVLEMKNELEKYGGERLLEEVAKKQLVRLYTSKKCREAIQLQSDYNLTIRPQEEESAFNCYLQLGQYEKALAISKTKIKDKSLEEKLKWTYKTARVYIKQGKNKALILVADDVEKLQELVKTDKYNDLIYDKIAAYYHLGGYEELMIKEVQKCEKLFPDSARNLDVFEKVLLYAKKKKETPLILNYAKKMIDLQDKYNLSTYTPKLELDYIEALRSKGAYKEALDEDIKLLYKKLNDSQRAHVLYIAGDLSEKLKKYKEAKDFYTKCGEIVDDSAWVELCSENLELIEDM